MFRETVNSTDHSEAGGKSASWRRLRTAACGDVPRAVELHEIGVGAWAARHPVDDGMVLNVHPWFGPSQRAT